MKSFKVPNRLVWNTTKAKSFALFKATNIILAYFL